ncbi:hypothetical protein ANN_27336 [Periplaneta americana]|uniref:Reverse transcriptase domain-containing protein n=1 Tax=Periplaneta americana TaxID=6978 RepID=A0ABQ8RXR0_PERAM|nr:hypothetical protein ANN_27336 [Periplaneta americana]
MAGLCESGSEPPGSLKASQKAWVDITARLEKPTYYGRNDHDFKIKCRKQKTDVVKRGAAERTEKKTVLLPIPKTNNAKKCNEFKTITLISHSAKIHLRILNRSLYSKMEEQLKEEQFGFRKGKDTRNAIGLLRTIGERYLE